MVEGDGVGGPYRLLVGRQRRFREGARPRVRRLDGRPRRTLQTLFDAGRGRCGEAPQHRGIAWEGGLVERVASARADVKARARGALAGATAQNVSTLLTHSSSTASRVSRSKWGDDSETSVSCPRKRASRLGRACRALDSRFRGNDA